MSGLYQRARKYIETQRDFRLVRGDEIEEADDLSISAEEREQILTQINEIVSRNRIRIDKTTFEVTAKKHGGVLPVMINVVALLLIAVGLFLVVRLFDRREATLVMQRGATVSAEGLLLEALREESEQRLSEKDREISSIRDRLSEMDDERRRLQADIEERVAEREAEMLAELNRTLEEERRRLAGGGLSEQQIVERMSTLERQQSLEYQRRLEEVRAEAVSELSEQERALDELTREYRESLSAAQDERVELQYELEERQSRLRAEFEARTSELEGEREAVELELDSLRRAQRREQLVLDQLLSFYEQIRISIGRGDLDAALASLGELSGYLNNAAVAELPVVQRRRQVELFLASSLTELIENERRQLSSDTRSLLDSAQLVVAVSELIARAETTFADGSIDDAEGLYRAALSRIPAVDLGVKRLEEIETRFAEEESRTVASYISSGNDYYLSGDYERAAVEYEKALVTLPAPDDQLLSRVLDAGYMMKRTGDLEELRRVRDELQAAAAASARTVATKDARIQELEDAVAGLDAELEVRARRLAVLDHAADASATRISELREAVTEGDGRIAALQRSLADRERGQSELLRARDGLAETVSEQRVEIERLRPLQAEAEKRRALSESIGSYIERFSRSVDSFPEAEDGARPYAPALEMLETKLLITRILGSEAVRSEHPDLHERLDRYLEALVQEQREETRIRTLREVDELVDGLSAAVSRPPDERLADDGSRSAFLSLLQSIRSLLR